MTQDDFVAARRVAFAVGSAYFHNRADADDMAQDTMVRLLSRPFRYHDKLAQALAHRSCVDETRRRVRRAEVDREFAMTFAIAREDLDARAMIGEIAHTPQGSELIEYALGERDLSKDQLYRRREQVRAGMAA